MTKLRVFCHDFFHEKVIKITNLSLNQSLPVVVMVKMAVKRGLIDGKRGKNVVK